ncbi:hypothetical protein TNIN_68861 [Trichonephila inaurata madagascariensis]|uniref:Uncharacterized protein n=1 Tax=Trichonephila inaurata madagascariensis TaxID=2747483 RepID=A0A8X6YVH5_9ARAC|nr:hypothetical protein TNIN_68861 [Trichonephila inaurata madagascariensis]
MSLPIFLIVSSDLMGLMYGLNKLDPFNNAPEEKIRASVYMFSIVFASVRGFFSFLCISMAASSIHEASQNAKNIQEDILKRLYVSGEKKEIEESLLLNTLYHSPPFLLSAWNVRITTIEYRIVFILQNSPISPSYFFNINNGNGQLHSKTTNLELSGNSSLPGVSPLTCPNCLTLPVAMLTAGINLGIDITPKSHILSKLGRSSLMPISLFMYLEIFLKKAMVPYIS